MDSDSINDLFPFFLEEDAFDDFLWDDESQDPFPAFPNQKVEKKFYSPITNLDLLSSSSSSSENPNTSPTSSSCKNNNDVQRPKRFDKQQKDGSHVSNNLPKKRVVNPIQYHFEPKEDWKDCELALDSLKVAYFSKKLGKKTLFQYKLWNALQITKYRFDLYEDIGVVWISQNVIKMNLQIFGTLLNLSSPKQSLFARRGSMISHGFVEILKEEAKEKYDLHDCLVKDVDDIKIKLFYHKNNEFGLFNGLNLETCKWVKSEE